MSSIPSEVYNSSACIPIISMSILLIGFACQWLAWRLKLPAILFLLISGVLLGPASSILMDRQYIFLNPSGQFQNLLYPIVSICVSIILFEGCLSLKFREIKGLGKTVRNIVSIGLVITIILTALSVHYIFGLSWKISSLIGAISSVSGPTVIIPILRSVRPTTKLSNIIRWEGMLIDPIGAILAVIVYTAITASQYVAFWNIAVHALLFVIVGGGGAPSRVSF